MKLLFDILLLSILSLVATAAPILSQPPAPSLEVVARGVAWAESIDTPKQTWREARSAAAAGSVASVESVNLPHGTWKEARDAEVAVGRAESSGYSDTPHSNWREAREEEDEDVPQAGDEDGEAPAEDENDLWSETETHQNNDSDPWDRDTFIADPTS
ncbi:hypothetical protein LQW54_012541 [Pestalotiopsis sp. IQ-011]